MVLQTPLHQLSLEPEQRKLQIQGPVTEKCQIGIKQFHKTEQIQTTEIQNYQVLQYVSSTARTSND